MFKFLNKTKKTTTRSTEEDEDGDIEDGDTTVIGRATKSSTGMTQRKLGTDDDPADCVLDRAYCVTSRSHEPVKAKL